MNQNLQSFWDTTWRAWRSGALSEISDGFSACEASLDGFMKTSSIVRNPLLSSFFAENTPRAGEFLIGYTESGSTLTMVLTSQRLWMYDRREQRHIYLDLASISDFDSKSGWNSFSVRVRLKDGTSREYRKMASVPSDRSIKVAMERCGCAGVWQGGDKEMPSKLLQKYLGDKPASLISFVYWGIAKRDRTVGRAVKASIVGGAIQAAGSVLGGQMAAGAIFFQQDCYTGHVGLLAVADEHLLFVSFGEMQLGDTDIPALTCEHLKQFLDLPEPVIERVHVADVWCSVDVHKADSDNSVLFHGKLDHQIYLIQSYPADVMGAVTSARQLVDSVNACASVAAPEKVLDMLASGKPPDQALVSRFVKDRSYLQRLRYLLVGLPQEKQEAVIRGLSQLSAEARSKIATFLREEAATREQDYRIGWLWLGATAAGFATLWLIIRFSHQLERHIPEVIIIIGAGIIGLFSLVGGPILALASFMGLGSAKWLTRIAVAIQKPGEPCIRKEEQAV